MSVLDNSKKISMRHNCIDNIKFLTRLKKKNLGDVEKKLGKSSGYLASINAENSTTLPASDFLFNASNEFGIPVEDLVYSNITEKSEDDILVENFIYKLLNDTRSEELRWQSYSLGTMETMLMFDEETNILVRDNIELNGSMSLEYQSPFMTNHLATIEDTVFYARLFDDSKVFIVPAKYYTQKKEPLSREYELLIVNGSWLEGSAGIVDASELFSVDPVAHSSSYEDCGVKLEELYLMITRKTEEQYLSDNARSVISRFTS